MSVNITVNGKFTKQTILDNPDRVKKELEAKRRTLRLQQVRAQSKELARKIRNDVSQEKEKQLRNLEAIKTQELNCWREHVLAQKCHDYQKSINEIGRAHKAAQAENEAKKFPKNRNIPGTSKFSNKTRTFEKKSEAGWKSGKTQGKEKADLPNLTSGKRNQVCFNENLHHCSCTYISDSEGDEKYDIDFTCSSLSSASSVEIVENTDTRCTQTDVPAMSQINVAVDTDTVPTVLVTENPLETKKSDKDTQLSPKKSTACTQTSIYSTTETTKTDDLSTSTSEVIENSAPPRFTQISDLIAKLKHTEIDQQIKPLAPQPNLNTDKNIISESTTKRSSPVKSPKSVNSHLLIAPKSSAVTILTPGTTERIASGSDSSSRVQYYDYRNKYSREYIYPTAKAVPQTDKCEPNAMERAILEKSLQKKRGEELEKLKQKSDERCQRALEREQVRRECIELTEKLDALTQNQQSLLPTDANLHNHQFYSIKTARKESKLNDAIEELLSRPAIITCPEVRNENLETLQNGDIKLPNKFEMHAQTGDLNMGATRERRSSEPANNNGSLSSDSSGSILLGYIDDQRDNIRKEITQCEANPVASEEKVDKLQKLLNRIESLRSSLLKEINKNEVEEKNNEPEEIKPVPKKQKKSAAKTKKNYETEGELQNQVAQVKATDKGTSGKEQEKLVPNASKAEIRIVTNDNQVVEYPQPGKPLEIVIKVQSERTAKKSSRLKMGKSTLTKQIHTEFKKSTKIFSNIPAEHIKQATAPTITRRNSYDSNSTAYRSIPAALTNASEQFVKRMSQLPQSETNQPNNTDLSTAPTSSNGSTTQAVAELPPRQTRPHLNPLIAQYIQRLLAMSRDSVNALEVSSSDVETPASSIVNITANMPSGDKGDSLLLSEDHVQRVERFITDNRSFINELEESFRTHSNSSLETSLRRLEEAWKQKFRNLDKKQPIDKSAPARSPALKLSKKQSKDKLKKKDSTVMPKQKPAAKRPKPRVPASNVSRKEKTVDQPSERPNSDSEMFAKSQTQLKHYAELTKNCSTRIAELTALITKVRAEKQRLLEITLTSVSDNERNSTEYRDLPATSKTNVGQQPDDAATGSGSSIGSPAANKQKKQDMDNVTTLPLEKHKTTGQSRDSGISMPSRPVTALGTENEAEPQSFVSSIQTTTTTHTTSSVYRKIRPPPALSTQSRYSPQAIEDEVAHELSTIVEVDTPATSRLNTSVPQQCAQQTLKPLCTDKEALRFPTFEEYVRINNLDLTTLDHEQSMLMENEYNELIGALKRGQGDEVVNYDAFPTLSAYLQNLTTNDEHCHTPETFEDLFECLRLTPVAAKPFPSHQEYLEQRKPKSCEQTYIDTDSLENAASGGASAYTETESETIDIEGELQRRNILKGSFRSISTRREMLPSTGHGKNSEHSNFAAHSTAIEVDDARTEKPNSSISDSASEKFQQELRALGLQWPQTMRKKEKQAAALSNSSSSEATKNILNDKSKKAFRSPKKQSNKSTSEIQSDSESSDRPLNLRDFLTRQLLKHAAATSSADSSLSGDSLRSQFFLAVLDSMTPPSGSPRANTNTTNRNERQKTSTPVPTPLDSASASNSTQLFSNESHISAVNPHAALSSTRNSQSNKSNTRYKTTRRDT